MRGVTHVGRPQSSLSESPDRDHASTRRELLDEPAGRGDLRVGRPPVRLRLTRLVRVRRDEVPENDVVDDPEFREGPMDDRRADLGRPGTGQLPLGREREPGNARSAIARCLTDQQQRSIAAGGEVVVETAPPQC